jgi:hypothetical protein
MDEKLDIAGRLGGYLEIRIRISGMSMGKFSVLFLDDHDYSFSLMTSPLFFLPLLPFPFS